MIIVESMGRVGRVYKVKQSTSGVTWGKTKCEELSTYFSDIYIKLSAGKAGIDYMQFLDVFVPDGKNFQTLVRSG